MLAKFPPCRPFCCHHIYAFARSADLEVYSMTFTLYCVVKGSVRSRAVCHHHHYLMPIHKQAINYYMRCKPKVLKVDQVVDAS